VVVCDLGWYVRTLLALVFLLGFWWCCVGGGGAAKRGRKNGYKGGKMSVGEMG